MTRKWTKHRLEAYANGQPRAFERGPLAVFWSSGNVEIIPCVTATRPRIEVQYEVVVAGRHVALCGTLKAARKAAP